MKVKPLQFFCAIICICVCVCCTGCNRNSGYSSASNQQSFTWQLAVKEYETKKTMHTIGKVTQYDGTIEEIIYDDIPTDGYIYVLLNLSINKSKAGGSPFEWDKLSLVDKAGNCYKRNENDSFLSNHNYIRMSGTNLILGENNGWVCFEVPVDVSNKKFQLVYSSDEGTNSISIN